MEEGWISAIGLFGFEGLQRDWMDGWMGGPYYVCCVYSCARKSIVEILFGSLLFLLSLSLFRLLCVLPSRWSSLRCALLFVYHSMLTQDPCLEGKWQRIKSKAVYSEEDMKTHIIIEPRFSSCPSYCFGDGGGLGLSQSMISIP
jgi:hypothetical protein